MATTHGGGKLLAAVAVLAILAGIGLVDTALAESSGDCIRADVPGIIVLPDGMLRPEGQLRICATRAFTPVTTMHKTYVDGRLIGLFRSRTQLTEGAGDLVGPVILFRRNRGGELVLQGYVLPEGQAVRSYRLDRVRRKMPAPPTASRLAEDPPILVAAVID